MSIPKVIYQAFIPSYDSMPDELRSNCERLRALNPDHAYRFYGEDEINSFIAQYYGGEVLNAYNKIHPGYPAAQVDLFRYLCIYEFGGIYLDIKAKALKRLSTLALDRDSFILSQWNNARGSVHENWGLHRELSHIQGGEYQQWHLIASPRHPFLRAVIEEVLYRINHYNHYLPRSSRRSVWATTGPIPYTLAIYNIRNQHAFRLVDIDRDFGIKYTSAAKGNDAQRHRRLYSDYRSQVHPLIYPKWHNQAAAVCGTSVKRILRRFCR